MEKTPLEARLASRCKHFNGLINTHCKAGIRYYDVADSSKCPLRYPCIGDHGSATCASSEYPTPEEIAEQVQRIREIALREIERMRPTTHFYGGRRIENQLAQADSEYEQSLDIPPSPFVSEKLIGCVECGSVYLAPDEDPPRCRSCADGL